MLAPVMQHLLCISVKLKNLKANHNYFITLTYEDEVVYIRKVKKSESKSQPAGYNADAIDGCVYP